MSIRFIDLIEVPTRGDTANPRVSSLAITDRAPNVLRVVGGLEHGCEFQPKTPAERDELVEYLQSIEYPEHQCGGCYRDEAVCSADPCMTVERERTEL